MKKLNLCAKTYVLAVSVTAALAVSSCATVNSPVNVEEQNISKNEQIASQQQATAAHEPVLKRKIAIGRFTNESQYGRSLLRDDFGDPLGKQLTDMMTKALTQSGQFIVLERPDLGRLIAENNFAGSSMQRVGADVLLMGSLTQFGRSTDGTSGFLSSTKRQKASATVDVRLVDVTNARVIASASGSGEATNESGSILGWGSEATYDGTLNEEAIGQAVSEVVSSIVSELADDPWKSYFLSLDLGQIAMSGGKLQGIRVGDEFVVKTEGRKVKSKQTGFMITLPGNEVARIRVIETFGSNEADEGSLCKVISGSLDGYNIDQLVIFEDQ